jgi:hypothetical protein
MEVLSNLMRVDVFSPVITKTIAETTLVFKTHVIYPVPGCTCRDRPEEDVFKENREYLIERARQRRHKARWRNW